MKNRKKNPCFKPQPNVCLASAIAVASLSISVSVYAENTESKTKNLSQIMMEEVTVTGTKKANAERLQDIPIAATAYSEEQLEMLHVRDLKGLSYSIPNASMEEVGTTKGVANFSFRGLGINSSIPSIDPTVGIFIDGIYLGINMGAVFDHFDLGGLEVLRGPQGILFGRNVTGGAVLLNTTNPSQEFEASAKVALESGDNRYVMGRVSGPLVEDKLLGKLALYNNDDGGYFENKFDGNDNFGQSDTTIIRGGLTYIADNGGELTLKYDHGETDGDGPASRNLALFESDSFDFSVDETGFYDSEWDFVSGTYTADIAGGTLTNIAGWRDLEYTSLGDIDGTPGWGYHASTRTEAEQFSEELRFNKIINDWIDLTVGGYFFTQELRYREGRSLAGGLLHLTGGGDQDQSTYGAFVAADFRLNEHVVVNTGIRYTSEEKEVEIFNVSAGSPCPNLELNCGVPDFTDDQSWSNITPKLGVQWFVNDQTQAYASYSKGFRSGGYNVRISDPSANPGPFGEEEQDSFEIGLKLDALDNRLRVNAAAFYNTVSDMQREVNVPSLTSGTVQDIRNTADATISGVEFEVLAALSDQLLLALNLGIIDGTYDTVKFDISGDGLIDAQDEALDLPRLAPLSAGVSLTWQGEIAGGHSLTGHLSYNHRDANAYSDSNLGYFSASNIVDANFTWSLADGKTEVSVFGRNLLDEERVSADVKLPSTPLFGYSGGEPPSFSPLQKGRVYGIELSYKY